MKNIDYYFTKKKIKLNRLRNKFIQFPEYKTALKLEPNIIINCSGLTKIDLCNKNYKYVFKENVKSIQNLINCLKDLNLKIVSIFLQTKYILKKINLTLKKMLILQIIIVKSNFWEKRSIKISIHSNQN